MDLETLRYPVGHFVAPDPVTATNVAGWIDAIEDLPRALREVVAPLDEAQLDTPYRVDGWTVRQVVHHLADSHMNSMVRFKLALTEDTPTIKPYMEDRWGELVDSKSAPVGMSLDLIDVLHRRWVVLLRSLGPGEWKREFHHPESGMIRVDANIGLYAWHGRHHLAHVVGLVGRQGWSSTR